MLCKLKSNGKRGNWNLSHPCFMQEVPLSVKTWRWCQQVVDWGLGIAKGPGAAGCVAFKAVKQLWHSISMKHTDGRNKDNLKLFKVRYALLLCPFLDLNCLWRYSLLCRGRFHDVAAGGLRLAVLRLSRCDEADQPLFSHWGKTHQLFRPWVSTVWKVLQHSEGLVCPQIKVPAPINKLHASTSSFLRSTVFPLTLENGSQGSNFALANFHFWNGFLNRLFLGWGQRGIW